MSNPEVTQYCPQCGESYEFAKFEMLDEIPQSTACRGCGFLLFMYARFKLEAVNALLASDSGMEMAMKAGDTDALNKYVETKVGLKRMKAR